MLYLSLHQNYIQEKDLHFERIKFDLKNERVRATYLNSVVKKVETLKNL